MTRDFTPVQEVLLAAIKVASLRFQAPEITLLRRELEALANRLDEWFVASQPIPAESNIEKLARAIRESRDRNRGIQPTEYLRMPVIRQDRDRGRS